MRSEPSEIAQRLLGGPVARTERGLDHLDEDVLGTPLPLVGVVPVQLIQAIPYVLTVCLLAGFVGRAVAPRAIGVAYVKER